MTPITIKNYTICNYEDFRTWWRAVENCSLYRTSYYIYGIAYDKQGRSKWAVLAEGLTKADAQDLFTDLRPYFTCLKNYKHTEMYISNVYSDPFDYEKASGKHVTRAYELMELVHKVKSALAS